MKKGKQIKNFPIIPFYKGDEHKAFTLVELIVVITILAILATIGFVSFSGYLAGTRDTNRIAQLKSMSDALELYRTKKDLPIPDDKIDIKANTKTIAYQGYIGKNVLETIEYTESGLDPKDKNYFSYYLTKNKKYFQLMAFLEEENEDVVAMNAGHPQGEPLQNNVGVPFMGTLNATDYSERYPKVTGKKLGILTDANNTPVQETKSGSLDISNVGTEEYKAIILDTEIISGTGTALAGTNPNASCKRIKQIKGGSSDGVYTIDPEANGTGFKVYCDMTTDGGGWTRIGNPITITDGKHKSILTTQVAKEFLAKYTGMIYYNHYGPQKHTHQIFDVNYSGIEKECYSNLYKNYAKKNTHNGNSYSYSSNPGCMFSTNNFEKYTPGYYKNIFKVKVPIGTTIYFGDFKNLYGDTSWNSGGYTGIQTFEIFYR